MAGRPESKIDWEKLDSFLEAGCSGAECAHYFGCHPNTLYRQVDEKYGCNISAYSQEKKAKGDVMIRDVRFRKALEGDNTMLIWLSKTRLGESEKQSDDKDDIIRNLLEFIKSCGKTSGVDELSKPELETS